jgi:hypothetical protein
VKHGKNPNREQKKLIASKGLDPAVWLVVKNTTEKLELVHRLNDRTRRVIHKGV